MNAVFNVQTLGVASLGKWILAKQDPSRMSLKESVQRGLWLERGLLFGVALDVATIGAGALLWQRGHQRSAAELTGFGQSLLLQGALLLVYDAVFWAVQRSYTGRLLDAF